MERKRESERVVAVFGRCLSFILLSLAEAPIVKVKMRQI